MNYLQFDIKDMDGVMRLIHEWKREKPKYVSFDTETNGLNIMHHRPFLISFGFITNDYQTIYTYTLDFELAHKQVVIDTMYVLDKIFKKAEKILPHNGKYDCHMLRNIGYPFKYWHKLSDTQFYIRLGHDAKTQDEGGPPLKLKEYASRYIDPKAKFFEQKLKDEITAKKRQATIDLKERLKGHPLPVDYNGKAKSWTMKVVEWFIKDKIHELRDLPSTTALVIQQWQDNTPDPENYQLLDRANVTEYAHYDIVYPLRIFLSLKDKIVERGQQSTLKREERAILPLYELEQNGIHFDYEKAILSKEKMRSYIIQLRKELSVLAGETVRVGQSKRLKELFFLRYGLNFANTEKDTLELIFTMDDVDDRAVRMVEIISELRSLEKWYSTYLIRWIEEAQQYGNIVYPTYHQVGTVTGRVSSAFQQFPKKGKFTIDGEYLFHPRELFLPPPGYKFIFFDYAAMEMRILAIFTMLIGHPDINLIRAFQPHDQDPNEWTPTDIHALTAKNAFQVTEDHPDFLTYYRPHGKATNFSIVYGATPKAISKKQKITITMAQTLYNAYFQTYPGVRSYNDYVRQHINTYGYAQNLFGRRYYGANAHKAKNYLIQGTGADYTKDLLPDIADMIRDTPIKLQGYLHDELSFVVPLDTIDDWILKIKTTMERLNVPITMAVDVEESTTSWKDKDEYDFE